MPWKDARLTFSEVVWVPTRLMKVGLSLFISLVMVIVVLPVEEM